MCDVVQVTNPKTMIYNTQNLPMMLSKILQAQIRNIAGTLDVDQVRVDVCAGLKWSAPARGGCRLSSMHNRCRWARSLRTTLLWIVWPAK